MASSSSCVGKRRAVMLTTSSAAKLFQPHRNVQPAVLELQPRCLADNLFGAAGVSHARQLHQQTVIAENLDDRLSESRTVDPALDDTFQPRHVFGVRRRDNSRVRVFDVLGAVNQVNAALQVQTQAEAKDGIAAALYAGDGDFLHGEHGRGHGQQHDDENERAGVPTHGDLLLAGARAPAREPLLWSPLPRLPQPPPPATAYAPPPARGPTRRRPWMSCPFSSPAMGLGAAVFAAPTPASSGRRDRRAPIPGGPAAARARPGSRPG